MMTSAEIRQSYLDFFRSKAHTLVPSSSLLPDSPNLLFTNAGMNQFVPIFLGQKEADVSRWAGAVPASDQRAADTQKCIRAGGKHNDLEDVGFDTYHHTFFEMLGNWSFGDYFKTEAINWAWELVVEIWKFPPARLYATIYHPDKAAGDPSERDEEAWALWAEKFRSVGIDPEVHIVNGNKKDNFWMMGETGPCGPCSELHVDLTPSGDTRGALVNKGSAECIEIWNLVFIQFNANPDGSFVPLPARHVDTGMGFERVCSIIQGTKGFSDFANARISNYETDVFRPIFDEIEKLSGKRYGSTLPQMDAHGQLTAGSEQEKIDVAFRVISDHIRTLSFAIADNIEPGNNDRHYVLRRILRRAVRYGRELGLTKPFFADLVDIIARTMGDIFPEIRTRAAYVKSVIRREEEAFNRTLDKGLRLFENHVAGLPSGGTVSGEFTFTLYDEQGFPSDLTALIARERGLTVDLPKFDELMDEQRERGRGGRVSKVITLSELKTKTPTRFDGYDRLSLDAKVLEVLRLEEVDAQTKKRSECLAVVLDQSPCYAEMGGQIGDSGEMTGGGGLWHIKRTVKEGNTWLHYLGNDDAPAEGTAVTVSVDSERRQAIQRHHTVTHLLHWALHEVVSREATQKGSSVSADKLTFDFNSGALTAGQVRDIEKLVNERIIENAGVFWQEVPHAEIRQREDIMQFFGDKYGDIVRVVQIGGAAGSLDGYSMELCGGTHTRGTGEIGLFRITSEAGLATGVRRIEAIAGLPAWESAVRDDARLRDIAGRLGSQMGDVEKKIDTLLQQQKDLEKALKAAQQREASGRARELVSTAQTLGAIPAIVSDLGAADGDAVQGIADALKTMFRGAVVLAGTASGAVSIVASVSSDFTAKIQAGKVIQAIAPIVGGKGGGKPDNARGGGKDAQKIAEALDAARKFITASA